MPVIKNELNNEHMRSCKKMGKLESEALKGKVKKAEVYVDWKRQLQDILDKNLSTRANGKIASFGTQSDRATFLFGFFNTLRELGNKVEPRNIKKRHIKRVAQEWERKKLSGPTLQKYFSHLRQYCEWINKSGLIGEAEEFLDNPDAAKRIYIATTDKSWDEKTYFDKHQLLQDIFNADQYVGIQVLMQDAFGLRRKESMCFRPYIHEKDGMIFVTDGAKGGKHRRIPVDDDYKRAVIKKAQQFVNFTQAPLGNPHLNLKQNLQRYDYVIRVKLKINKKDMGITGHGLRAGFAMRELEVRGLIPVLRGGKIGVMEKAKEKKIRMEVAELLGHHRTRVTTAYSGAETYYGLLKLSKFESKQLEKMVTEMEVGRTYRFTTFEYTTEDKEVIESQVMDRKFLSMLQVEDRYYFEVERAVPQLEHVIALEHVKSITIIK